VSVHPHVEGPDASYPSGGGDERDDWNLSVPSHGRVAALRPVSKYLLPSGLLALAFVLILSSVRTYHDLEGQKMVYLLNRVSRVAQQLERLPPDDLFAASVRSVAESEPNLIDLRLLQRSDAQAKDVESLWNGEELFRTEFVSINGKRIFRSFITLGSSGAVQVAKVDLDASAADFITANARTNLIAASFAGSALVLLSLYAVWSARRNATLAYERLQLQHLAHIGTMATALAHEIRNPLGAMKGFAQLACRRASPDVAAYLEPILRESRRLERVVDDLLLYGRAPTPCFREVEWRDFEDVLRINVGEMIGASAIRFDSDGQAFRFRTDPDILRQALLNVLRNSVEALSGQEHGVIALRTAFSEAGLCITVTDNGPGVPEAVRKRLFEPFFTTKASGTGLGLAISRRLIATLNGRLELNPAVPSGAVAVIYLPAAKAVISQPAQ